jgi:hypothetical protein
MVYIISFYNKIWSILNMEEDKGNNYIDFTVSYSDDVHSSDYITQFLNLG